MNVYRRFVVILPVSAALLLSGCGYVHFGRLPPASVENTALAEENAALRKQLVELSSARSTSEPAATTLAVTETPATPLSEDEARQLAEIESKLTTALRSYRLLQDENDQLKATAEKLAVEKTDLEGQLAGSNTRATELSDQLSTSVATARLVESLRTQLRQTQDQLNAVIAEYSQLRARNSLSAPAPGSVLAVPTRPGSALFVATPPVDLKTPAAPEPRQHIVAEGDTLSKIARQYYGNSQRWPEILTANRAKLPDDRSLTIGMKLLIP